MQTLSQIKELLESRGLSPKRSLGQNFLIDQNLIRKLIDAAGAPAGSLVVEVGPGTGTLTEALLERGYRVIACELDDALAGMLKERAGAGEVPGAPRLDVVHADCLESKEELSAALREAIGREGDREFSLIANLPYGAATPLIMTLLLKYPRCKRLAVTIQSEVAERLSAPARTHERGMLSVIAQAMSEVERVATLPRECFWPRPEVTSAMVVMRRRPEGLVSDEDVRPLSEFCKRLFAHRRKQLRGVLGLGAGRAGGAGFEWPEGVGERSRAEELTVPQVLELFHRWRRSGAGC
ncbi:MAG: 16S rRNA (adenine(1518)-N(6)/adenine(1519)-N(6))-dimethyltransferase RsmA [Phycisphaerales bacterium]